jgi:calcium/calmodulin-dependent protein kinase I
VHRDIKLENVMMTDSSGTAVAKLIDFGLAKILGPKDKSNDIFGTFGYCAPEVIMAKSYSLGVDIWSLGVILYVILSEYLPFDHEDKNEIANITCNQEVSFDLPEFEKYD